MRAMVWVLAAMAWGGDRGMPFWVEVEPDCRTVADVATAWLRERRVKVRETAVPRGVAAAVILRLDSDRARNTAGRRIFYPESRYVMGGRWYSFFTGAPVRGWLGLMTLRVREGGGCLLSLQGAHKMMPPDYEDACLTGMNCEMVYSTLFSDEQRPLAPSNGRLEREYTEAILRALPRK